MYKYQPRLAYLRIFSGYYAAMPFLHIPGKQIWPVSAAVYHQLTRTTGATILKLPRLWGPYLPVSNGATGSFMEFRKLLHHAANLPGMSTQPLWFLRSLNHLDISRPFNYWSTLAWDASDLFVLTTSWRASFVVHCDAHCLQLGTRMRWSILIILRTSMTITTLNHWQSAVFGEY